jgi:hypothetical protein
MRFEDSHGQIVGNADIQFIGAHRPQNQDGGSNAAPAQAHGLFRQSCGQPVGAVGDHGVGGFQSTMPVTVGLHHCHELTAGADELPELLYVVCDVL